MYTIYIKQSSIRIVNTSKKPLERVKTSVEPLPDEVLEVSDEYDCIPEIRKILDRDQVYHLLIRTQNPKSLVKNLKDSLHYIKAGGGLIKNERKQYLFIYRLGLWDLPKGKMEAGEDEETCALREVEEETGIKINLVKKELPSTYHIYELDGKIILKRTYWFLMKALDNQILVPQLEENIWEARWFSTHELDEIRANTYPSILEVMESIPSYGSDTPSKTS